MVFGGRASGHHSLRVTAEERVEWPAASGSGRLLAATPKLPGLTDGHLQGIHITALFREIQPSLGAVCERGLQFPSPVLSSSFSTLWL